MVCIFQVTRNRGTDFYKSTIITCLLKNKSVLHYKNAQLKSFIFYQEFERTRITQSHYQPNYDRVFSVAHTHLASKSKLLLLDSDDSKKHL